MRVNYFRAKMAIISGLSKTMSTKSAKRGQFFCKMTHFWTLREPLSVNTEQRKRAKKMCRKDYK